MKCSACGCRERWTEEEVCPVEGHPNVEVTVKLCECGHWQEEIQ